MLRAYAISYTARNWKRIIAVSLVILLLPLFMIIAIVVTLTQSVYIESDETNVYLEVVEQIESENGVNIDYSQLVGIDAVRYMQDFSKANETNVRELAEMFIEEKGTDKSKVVTSKKSIITEQQFKNDTVFLGDSLTYALAKFVPSVANQSVATGGYTTKDATNKLADKVIVKKPKIVVCSFGTNDAGAGNPTSFIRNYKELINKLQQGIPGVKIYINQIFPGDASKTTNKGYLKVIKNIPSYNKVLPQIAQETGATLIDCNNQVKSGVYDDGIHFKKDFYKNWLNEMERQVVGGAISSSGSNGNYRVKTIEEVGKELGFSETDIKLAKELSTKAQELIGDFGDMDMEIDMVADVTGQKGTPSEVKFISSVLPGALASYKKYKIYPSVTLAQAILESGWGKSGLTKKGNNLFGIKSSSAWKGESINMRTAEYTKSNAKYYINANFRKYPTLADSIIDHAKFLNENSRYANHGVFVAKNSSQQAFALQRAGYATSPIYAVQLISLIKRYDLDRYDTNEYMASSDKKSESNFVIKGESKYIWPLPGHTRISSPYGYRICPYHGKELHPGLDIPAPSGTDVLATASGRVITARFHNSLGNYVEIDHGNGIVSRYAHNSKLLVKVGDAVKQGQVISKVGSTGSSTGPHSHFEIRVDGQAKPTLNYVKPK